MKAFSRPTLRPPAIPHTNIPRAEQFPDESLLSVVNEFGRPVQWIGPNLVTGESIVGAAGNADLPRRRYVDRERIVDVHGHHFRAPVCHDWYVPASTPVAGRGTNELFARARDTEGSTLTCVYARKTSRRGIDGEPDLKLIAA